ncbi:N/A [soil metagenome]
MTASLEAEFEKRYPGGVSIRADLRWSADGFSITVLFGPSGCGKTTILRCLAGLERPERGRIRFGESLWFDAAGGVNLPPQRRGIGYLSQDYALFPHLSVARNIAYGIGGVTGPERRRRVAELLDLLGLEGLGHRYPGQVSGGQQQRVALARALARRPRFLLLDEPLSALDAPTREHLRRGLRHCLSGFGTPTVIVTHDWVEAMALADHVVILDEGQVRQAGTVEEVFARPADLAVARIVGVETVVPAWVIGIDEGLATVEVGGTRLVALADGATVGQVYACIRAEEVLLKMGEVGPSSVPNQVAGIVRSLSPEGPMIRVVLECGFPMTALVTRPAYKELGLHEGATITALVEAPAIHLIPRSEGRGVSDGGHRQSLNTAVAPDQMAPNLFKYK